MTASFELPANGDEGVDVASASNGGEENMKAGMSCQCCFRFMSLLS